MKPRKVKLTGGPSHGGWIAKVKGLEPLVAESVDALGEKVRQALGDRAWVWKPQLGEDSDWYIMLHEDEFARLGQGLLANTEARSKLADAVWAIGLVGGSKADASALLGVPLEWIERVHPGPGDLVYHEGLESPRD